MATHTTNFVISSQDFHIEFLKIVIDLKKFIKIWHGIQDNLETGDFRKNWEDRSYPFKRGISHSKQESWNISVYNFI